MRKISSLMRKAISTFDMIQEGDKIAVGLSGGKDSLSLLSVLKNYQLYAKENFELIAISVDLFNGATDYSHIQKFCDDLKVELIIVPSNIYSIVFDIRKESNPCSLCANMRRGILNSKAKELGCNKVALGHHKDDFVQTFFLSLFYEGRLSSFQPVTYLDHIDITVIRPFLYVPESLIVEFSKLFPIINSCCPANKKTKREYIKNLISQIEKDIPQSKDRVFDAITHTERNNLYKTTGKK